MPLTVDQLTYKQTVPHGSATLIYEHAHPLLQQLEAASAANDLPGVQSALAELGTFPPEVFPGRARVCVQRALAFASAHLPNDTTTADNTEDERPILKALLAHGLGQRSEFTDQAIDEAIKRQDLAMLETFASHGWDVNEAGWGARRRPALRLALLENTAALRTWLLARGADPNLEDERRTTPLEAAAAGWAPVAVLRELLAHGGDPARAGDESLLLAAETGDLERAEILVGAGADVNGREKEGGVGCFAPQRRGRTVLNAAVEFGREAMVRWLLERGARADQRDGRGRTAFDVARDMKMDGILAILGS